jgi:hypothetical protein
MRNIACTGARLGGRAWESKAGGQRLGLLAVKEERRVLTAKIDKAWMIG